MKTMYYYIIFICFFISKYSYSQDYKEVAIVVGSDIGADSKYGQKVSISGDYAIVSAATECKNASGINCLSEAGAAYIFERDASGNWNEVQKLVASDRNEGDLFGCSVDISGNYAVVGAYLDEEDATGGNLVLGTGSAYIFKRESSGNWVEIQKIVASDRSAFDYFGYSVSISGDFIVVAAPYDDEDCYGMNKLSDAGSAYIFKCDEHGNWLELQKISASDRAEYDHFGNSLSFDGNHIILSSPVKDEVISGGPIKERVGSAYIFRWSGYGVWVEAQKINAGKRDENDFFGWSVSISGDYAFVGASQDNDDNSETNALTSAGSVYIFKRNASKEWIFTQKIVASDRGALDNFGSSVSLSGKYAVVGAYNDGEDATGANRLVYAGSAYFYKLDESGKWNETQKISASDRGRSYKFGSCAALDNNYAIIGTAISETGISGKAYIFESCGHSGTSDPDNIIVNGDFGSCSTAPWRLDEFSGASGTINLTNGCIEINDINITNDPIYWHLQLIQPFSEEQINRLKAGNIYRLSFRASAEKDNRPCVVYFGQDGPPYNGAIKDEEVLLSKEMKYYKLDFSLSEIYPSMYLALEFGMEASSVTIDEVRLEWIGKDTDGDLVEDSEDNCPYKANRNQADSDNDGVGNTCDNCPHNPNRNQADSDHDGIGDACETNTGIPVNENQNDIDIKVYPNPVSDVLYIQTRIISTATILDQTGRIIKMTSVPEKDIHFNVSDLPDGLYIVRINNEFNTSVKKIIVY